MADFPQSECLGLAPYTKTSYEPNMGRSGHERVYEFVLSPSMFSDFAFEAYGKGIVDVIVGAVCLCFIGVFLFFAVPDFPTLSITLKCAVVFFGIAELFLVASLCFPGFRKRFVTSGRIQREVDLFDWFDYGGPMFPSLYSAEHQGTSTPCRFVVMDDRVRLMRMPAGRMVVEDVPWAAFGKVTVTRSCVVLRPGALDRGSIHFSGPYWSHVSAGGIGCSVLVGLDAVSDVDAFVKDCRSRIAEATSRVKEEAMMGGESES
ncbi:hypothetical protein OZX62_07410 [Bifidobacterium sp. ESL0690]|uniref:hypothetical protein n=1 Tax=Bifidobacterium sp. ESL0690 TaxID=2983214 RepID=UPI0023FA4397|nr:hypothetical protein [Bifidobacterium sp. ESL0690]WEV46265.1 hypothetical protein OZX62_07410 [Bifidobacterium sp. ESL0690]